MYAAYFKEGDLLAIIETIISSRLNLNKQINEMNITAASELNNVFTSLFVQLSRNFLH